VPKVTPTIRKNVWKSIGEWGGMHAQADVPNPETMKHCVGLEPKLSW
jgi:hypothetical protein